MKLKKILSGFLAAAMAVTTMVTATFNASAEDPQSYITIKGNTTSYAMSSSDSSKTMVKAGTNTYDFSYTSGGYPDSFVASNNATAISIRIFDVDKRLSDISLLSVSVDGVDKGVSSSDVVDAPWLYDEDIKASVEKSYTITLSDEQLAKIGDIPANSTIIFKVQATYDTTPTGGSKWTKKAAGVYKFISAARPEGVADDVYSSDDILPEEESVDLSDLLPTGKTLADIRKIKITASIGSWQFFNGAIATNIITAEEPTDGKWASAACKVAGTADPSTTLVAELETPLGVAAEQKLKLQTYSINYSTTVDVKIEVVVAVPHTITIDPAIENGSVTPDKTEAEADEKVTLTVTPDEGYELDGDLTVKEKTSGAAVTVATDGTFTMPDDAVTVTAAFKASAKPVTAISIAPATATVVVGKTLPAPTVTYTPADTTDTKAVTWSSSDTAVATVNETTGVVSGVKAGEATITATFSETIKATYTVTVTADEVPCTKIELDKTEATVKKGETVTLTAAKTPENTTDTVTWASDDTAVATVENGVVTAKARGTATITVTCGDQTATCKVSVNEEETVTAPASPSAPAKTFSSAVTDGKYNENDVFVISADDVKNAKSVTITVTDSNGKKTTKEVTECYKKVTYTAADKTSDTITAGANYLIAVTVTGIPDGTTVTVTATVNK